jgi:hypothetical protein
MRKAPTSMSGVSRSCSIVMKHFICDGNIKLSAIAKFG